MSSQASSANSFLASSAHDRPIDVVCMGRVAVDLYCEQIHSPLTDGQTFRKYLGGCAGNIAVGSARLGLKSAMLSCVGTDAMGQFLKQQLVTEGVDTRWLAETPDHLTGLVILGVDPPDRFPLIFYRQDCADMQLKVEHVSDDLLAQAKALLITGTGLSHPDSQAVTLHAAALAKRLGTKVIIDLDYRPVLWGLTPRGDGETRYQFDRSVSDVFAKVLPFVDAIVGTDEEVLIAGGCAQLPGAIASVRSMSSGLLVLKKGVDGCLIYRPGDDQPTLADPYPVSVLNVLGAGDGFMSGFLSGLLTGQGWNECADRGNACGAIVVSRHGCSPAIPSMDELKVFRDRYRMDARVLEQPAVERLHRRVVLKDHDRQMPMHIMAFCHRWQFERDCAQNDKPLDLVRRFKSCIYRGAASLGSGGTWILTDPVYGASALQCAVADRVPIICPIEASGPEELSWLELGSAYDILIRRPQTWGVKVLWRFHCGMDAQQQRYQMSQLRDLDLACRRLDRRLMVELLAPTHIEHSVKGIADAMEATYRHGIEPYWWKLPPVDSAHEWTMLTDVIDEWDAAARIVILGGGLDPSAFDRYFAAAQSSHHGIGFAIGRTVFWSVWQQFRDGILDEDQTAKEISDRFADLIHMWNHATAKEPS